MGSWAVSKAFGRYRTRQRLPGAVDFHSFRRTLITRLENLGVDQVRIARYVGHELPTLAFSVYSGGATEETQRATARAIEYPAKVEKGVRGFLRRCVQSGS
jgi:integrase